MHARYTKFQEYERNVTQFQCTYVYIKRNTYIIIYVDAVWYPQSDQSLDNDFFCINKGLCFQTPNMISSV